MAIPTSKIDHIPGTIILHAHKVNGLGDVSGTFKIAGLLHERLGVAKDKIVIALQSKEDAKIFNTKHSFSIISPEDKASISDAALQIIYPYDHGCEVIAYNIPSLLLSEYGHRAEDIPAFWSKWIKSASLGLGKDEIGILIDDSMASTFSEGSLDPIERLHHLEKLNPVLQTAILGSEGTLDSRITAFEVHHRLYVGYASDPSSYLSFIHAIALLNPNNSGGTLSDIAKALPTAIKGFLPSSLVDTSTLKSPVIFLTIPGSILSRSLAIASRYYKTDLENFLRDLKSSGYGKIEIWNYTQDKGSSELVYEASGEKNGLCEGSLHTIKVIAGPLSAEDLKTLFLASEKETVATGDQSLSEALSANKDIAYEALIHKEKLAHSLANIAPSQECYFKRAEACLDLHVSRIITSIFKRNIEDNYRALTARNLRIIKEKDCTPHLASILADLYENKDITQAPDESLISSPITPETMPFDKVLAITLSQLAELKIGRDDRSEVKGFEDSVFDLWPAGTKYYIFRKKSL